MSTQWYYQVMGEERGPVSSSDLAKQAQAGVITPDTFVRRADDENWHVAQSVSGLFDKRASSAPPGSRDSSPAPPKPQQELQTREMAEKLCNRIRDAMSGILGEVEDEELNRTQITQICETLRPIARRLEELEGSL
jgi:hypothetical protein